VVMRSGERIYRNPYSLMGSPLSLDTYEVAIRRADQSRGGSAFMHEQVKVGTHLEVAQPVNLFPLAKTARKHILIAGGIGITPFMAQLVQLRRQTAPYELHYSVRSLEHGPFCERLKQDEGDKVVLYYDDAGQRMNFHDLLSNQLLGTHVYVCGPGGMIEAVVNSARAAGWSDSHIHWEQFVTPPVGESFDVFLAKAGINVHVPAESSLLEAIEAAGVDAPYLCRGGVCGTCETDVIELEGEIFHYDSFLSDEEKASCKKIMPCISRARCKSLVLNL
jgi:dimethylamine monooxygenase subunit B